MVSLVFPAAKCYYAEVFLFLKYIVTEALLLLLIGLGLASGASILELSGTGSIGHKGIFYQLLKETTF